MASSPIQKVAMVIPVWMGLQALVTIPFFARSGRPIGKHFGMDAEISLSIQTTDNCLRNGSDAHLNSVAILDQFESVFAYFSITLSRIRSFECRNVTLKFHEMVEFRNMEPIVSINDRKIAIDFANRYTLLARCPSFPNSLHREKVGQAEIYPTLLIWRTDHGDINIRPFPIPVTEIVALFDEIIGKTGLMIFLVSGIPKAGW